jgi:probable rRNA maturation factor
VKQVGPRVSVRSRKLSGVRPVALRRAIEYVLAHTSPHIVGDVTVVLVSDRTIRELNRRFRGLDRPTDVLAFPLGEGLAGGEPFGDIVISHETARRRAREYGARLEVEVLRLTIHAVLHLCGYDHHERNEAARMHRLSRKLLKELNALG